MSAEDSKCNAPGPDQDQMSDADITKAVFPEKLPWSETKLMERLSGHLSTGVSPDTCRNIYDDFTQAYEFTLEHHRDSLERLSDRGRSLVRSFGDFFEEYVYVVIASGFRGRTAGALTPRIISTIRSGGDPLSVFRNRTKVKAIQTVWGYQASSDEWWQKTRRELRQAQRRGPGDALKALREKKLPYIGEITSIHLARNIGLANDTAKPDLHLVRYAEKLEKQGAPGLTPHILVSAIAEAVGEPLTPGLADFALWVWLSHSGETKECCDGALIIR